jgi:hypothetical protein
MSQKFIARVQLISRKAETAHCKISSVEKQFGTEAAETIRSSVHQKFFAALKKFSACIKNSS